MDVRLAVAVQHHPSRAGLLPGLLAALEPLTAEVVTDPDPTGDPSPWRCYRECLERMPADATHRLIVQDDAAPAPGFAAAALAAIEARPDRPIAFWIGGQPADVCTAMRRASLGGKRFVDVPPWRWFPCVASVWPAALVTGMLDWANENPAKLTRCDDGTVARFFQARRIWPLVTVPCLVEHPDVELSVIGRKAWAGRDKGRVACIPPPEVCPETGW